MRRAGIFIALAAALVLVPSRAWAKGDFFEFRITGPGLPQEIGFRLTPTAFGEPAGALVGTAEPRYRVGVAIGFNRSGRLIPMPWSLTYFPPVSGRPARILERGGPGVERWWAPGPDLRAAFDAKIPEWIAAFPWKASRAGPPPPGAPRPWLGIIIAPLATAVVLTRRGRVRGGRRPGRAGPA